MGNMWERVHQMAEDDLATFAEEHRVDMSGQFLNLSAAADHVCAALQIAEPTNGHEGEDLDRLTQEYALEHRCSYTAAFDVVRKKHPKLAEAYVVSFGVHKAAQRS